MGESFNPCIDNKEVSEQKIFRTVHEAIMELPATKLTVGEIAYVTTVPHWYDAPDKRMLLKIAMGAGIAVENFGVGSAILTEYNSPVIY